LRGSIIAKYYAFEDSSLQVSSSSPYLYSWSKFGREAEFIVVLYLKLKGWNIQLSKGSRGPADIIATQDFKKWLIQVKSSTLIPRLKGSEVKRLRKMAQRDRGDAVIATLQPIDAAMGMLMTEEQNILGSYTKDTAILQFGNYVMSFYSLINWKRLRP
jgi:Holliday junction resolvase